ncbi:MAG: class I SAM-dependent methyltransferase [Desulfobacula sp.]|jgi:SAM-dependent methyltransferase|nr:class I SAM-dependent methyltransferase [Desulfobacula sp.]
MSEFDSHSKDYKKNLDQSVRFSGESSDYFAAYKARYISKIRGRVFSGRILDFGCGVGLLSRHLSEFFPLATIYGYDISRESIMKAQALGIPRASFITRLDDTEGVYDLIVVANVLHHVEPEQRDEVLGAVVKQLKTGGQLFIFEHNPLNPIARMVVSNCPFDTGVQLLKSRELMDIATRQKVKVDRIDYIVFFPRQLSLFRFFEPYLCRLPLGGQYVLVARR